MILLSFYCFRLLDVYLENGVNEQTYTETNARLNKQLEDVHLEIDSH